ncbi:KH domain-containing protein [Candidatus Saccharibacteria bacterium]|nr:KH domain-containing protein [Candidatus Saccharibacteria bacterium]
MATIDQQFVEYIVKTLVNNPEKVSVERKIDEKGVLLSLSVDPEDVGRVIGKRGATAQSIRTLLRALGTKNDARYNLKIVNTDAPEGAERSAVESSDAAPEATSVDEIEDDTRSEDLAEKTRQEMDDLDDLDI